MRPPDPLEPAFETVSGQVRPCFGRLSPRFRPQSDANTVEAGTYKGFRDRTGPPRDGLTRPQGGSAGRRRYLLPLFPADNDFILLNFSSVSAGFLLPTARPPDGLGSYRSQTTDRLLAPSGQHDVSQDVL